MNLFEKIKKIANQKGISLTKLSIDAGLGEKTIYKWKTQVPKTETLKKVADQLNVSIDSLLNDSENKSNQLSQKEILAKTSGLFRAYAKDEKMSDAEAREFEAEMDSFMKIKAQMIKEARKNKKG